MAYTPMSINALPETIVVRDEKGNIHANNIGEGSHGGVADTAKKLETPFNLSISGFVSADAVSVDGSKDVTLVTKDITDLNVSSLAVSGETQLANVNISGNLSVAGTTTTVDSENITVKDNIITLNEGETGEGVTKGTAGIEVNRGTLPTYKILFDENDDMFKVGTDEQMEIIASQPYVTEEVNKKAAEIEEKIPDTTNMVTYSEFEYNGTKRKTIQLANYDSISGVTTCGVGANLIMVSKWDKVDIGTSNLECNLNAKDGIVTINDDKTIATVDQIPSTENFATKEELSAKADSVHTHKIADIIDLNLDTYATKEELANYATTTAVTEEINNKAIEIEEKIPDTTNMVTYSEFEYGDTKRKTIQLANYDSISGVTTGGEGANLIMVSKWDKVDVGTSNLECNLNAKDGVVTINDDKTIATVDQIPSTENFVTKEELSAKADITYVDQKVADLVNGAPEALDTLNELAIALNENKDGVTVLLEEVGQINTKVDAITVDSLGAAHAEHKHVIADITDINNVTSELATKKELPHIINIPIRSLSDKIYEKTEIFEWFGVETDVELKKYISGNIPLFVKYGISYSALPHYYKFPVEYIAYESDNQVKLVFTGLDTRDDSAVKYEIICNLDGSVVAETSSNVSLVLTPIDNEVDLSGYDTSEEVDEKVSSLGVVNLGNFNTSGEAENKAKEDGVYNDVSKKVLVYTVNNTDSGYIINDVYGTGTTQYLYLKGKRYSRNIVSGEATPFVDIHNYVALPKKAINGLDFFKLTTDSSAEDIKAAMSAGGELITESDLDSCLAYGFAIREYTMQSNTIFVGFNGTGFTFTYIGYPNPKKDLVVKSITVKVDGDIYEVLVNGTSGTILTSSNLEADLTFSNIKSQLATTTDIANTASGNIEQLVSRMTAVEEQLSALKKTNVVPVVMDEEANLNQADADLVLTAAETPVTGTTTVVAKSVDVKSLSGENTDIKFTTTGDFGASNINLEGDLPKSTSNAQLKIQSPEYVKITNSVLNQTGYNTIEIGLDSGTLPPKNIIIDNIDFTATMTNNAILIFGHQDDAVITISNCHFASVSNAVRISNRLNKRGTFNFINCTCDKWDVNPTWAGFVICQDYTSGSKEAEESNNLFAPDKITINFINCYGPHGKIMADNPEDVCGTGNSDTQVLYVWNSYGETVGYDASRYPTVNFK